MEGSSVDGFLESIAQYDHCRNGHTICERREIIAVGITIALHCFFDASQKNERTVVEREKVW
jgi:hypothetical protein